MLKGNVCRLQRIFMSTDIKMQVMAHHCSTLDAMVVILLYIHHSVIRYQSSLLTGGEFNLLCAHFISSCVHALLRAEGKLHWTIKNARVIFWNATEVI